MTLEEANKYIKDNKEKVIKTYRHRYHLMAPIGWINDPNGFCIFKNKYHLFYQYYPYDSKWGPMHWGHVISRDLIKWEHLPVALAPDTNYQTDGVFSGSAIEIENKLYLFYTGHKDPDKNNPKEIRQVQCLAISEDGIKFKEYKGNPIIKTEQLPENALIQDFRDPNITKINNKYYLTIGSRTLEGKGQILFYVSEDLINWEYLNRFSIDNFGTVWECPDLFKLDGFDVILISPQFKEREGDLFCNVHSSIALVGEFNAETGEFKMKDYYLLDSGFDFYAPQTTISLEGYRVMIAWMNMWERTQITHKLGHGWTGSMTLPRELSFKKGKLYQTPTKNIINYRTNERVINNFKVNGGYIITDVLSSHELIIQLEDIKGKVLDIYLFDNEDERFIISIDGISNQIVLDRSNMKNKIESKNVKNDYVRKQPICNLQNGLKLNVFIDISSVEIFINDGEYVMTSLVFPNDKGSLKLYSKYNIIVKCLKMWDIEV